MYQIQELSLNLQETLVGGNEDNSNSDKGLGMLYEGLSEMAQLKKFHLLMDFTKTTDIGFNHIAKSLINKKDLVELVLSFKET